MMVLMVLEDFVQNIVVLKYAEMKDKLEYAKNTYGNDFINMLESKHD